MIHPVRIPHEQVNDESVLLVEWMVADRTEVKAGQPIAVIETSKSTGEIESPTDGYLRHGTKANVEMPVGAVFCHVTTTVDEPIVAEAGEPTTSASTPAPTKVPAPSEPVEVAATASLPPAAAPHFSRRALELIEKHGLSKEAFDGKGLVREADVIAFIAGRDAATAPANGSIAPAKSPETAFPSSHIAAATGVPVRSEDLPRAKRVEIKYLASGQQHTLPSVVTVACPAAGIRAALKLCPDLGSSATPLIVYEVARLLKKYPAFNAFYDHGRIHYYEQVNIGVAVDGGRGLKVPVIANADKKDLVEIAREMEALLLDYVNDTLPLDRLAGGTFTITDLSAEDVLVFHPLINQGQSGILGVGAEYSASGAERTLSNLVLAFDHQLTEGKAAARMLKELRDRIATYADARANELACGRCHREVTELQLNHIPLLEEIHAGGEKTLICKACLMGVQS